MRQTPALPCTCTAGLRPAAAVGHPLPHRRWLVFLLTAPILVALWLVGAVLWVVLLPLKLCCPCCGLPIGWAASLVLWLLALPARGLRYAAGSPFEEQQSGGGKEQGKK